MNKSTNNRIVVLGVLAFLMVASGCKKKVTPPPPPPTPKPVSATLSANPTSIEAGQSATNRLADANYHVPFDRQRRSGNAGSHGAGLGDR